MRHERMEAWIADTMERTPGLKRAEAAGEYFKALAEQEKKTVQQVVNELYAPPTIREMYSNVVEPLTALAAEGIGRFFQGMTEGPSGFARPVEGATEMASRMTAETVIPQTPEAAVLTAAAPGLQALRPFTGRAAMLNPLLRTGASTGVGAGVAAATGGSPKEGAGVGAMSGVAGEFFRLPGSTKQLWKEHMGTQKNRMRWAAEDAADLVTPSANATAPLFADVPQLLPALRAAKSPGDFLASLEQVHKGHQKPLGDVLISKHYAKTEKAVFDHVGPDTQYPSRAHAIQMGIDPAAGLPGITLKDALKGLKLAIEDSMRPKNKGPSGQVTRDVVDEFRQEIRDVIKNHDPALAKRWWDESGLYRRGKAFLTGLHESGALRGTTRSTKAEAFDADAFLDYMRDNQKIGFLPNVEAALLRGSARNAVTRYQSLPRGRIYKAGESATFMLPALRVEKRGGFKTPATGWTPSIAEAMAANTISGYLDE